MLTLLSNMLNSQNLTDAHTCYKVVKREIFDNIYLEEFSFSFCPELTTKLSKLNEKIFETIYHASLEKSIEISQEREKDMKHLIQEYNHIYICRYVDNFCRLFFVIYN